MIFLTRSIIEYLIEAYVIACLVVVSLSLKSSSLSKKLANIVKTLFVLYPSSALVFEIYQKSLLSNYITYIISAFMLSIIPAIKLFPNMRKSVYVSYAIFIMLCAILFRFSPNIDTLVVVVLTGFILGFLSNCLRDFYLMPRLSIEYILVVLLTTISIVLFINHRIYLCLPALAISLLLLYRKPCIFTLTLLSGFAVTTVSYTYLPVAILSLVECVLSLMYRPRYRAEIPPPYTWIGTYLGGRYLGLDVVGLGGFSYVLKVADDEGKMFAAKILKENYAKDSRVVQEFREEMSKYLKLDLKCVVKVFEVHIPPPESREYIEDPPYAIMELAKTTLRKLLLLKGPLPLGEFFKLSIKISAAIQELHSRGLLHLDLKPENILIMDTKDYNIKLCDLGSAKESREYVPITQISYLYAAPEMLQKFVGTQQSDVYSLGCIFYEMLTGKVPNEFYMKNVPVPPLRSIRQDVPEELEKLIMSMLDRDPARRPTILQVFRTLTYLTSRYSTSKSV